MGKHYSVKQFESAIPGSGGIITTIARRVGCSWHTAASYLKDSPTLARLYEDEASTIDDLAESVVIKSMQEGDINAAKWWLERRRRAKFATRHELGGPDGGPVVIQMTWGDVDAGDGHDNDNGAA